jgi:hypothetical protein
VSSHDRPQFRRARHSYSRRIRRAIVMVTNSTIEKSNLRFL